MVRKTNNKMNECMNGMDTECKRWWCGYNRSRRGADCIKADVGGHFVRENQPQFLHDIDPILSGN